VNDFAVEVKQAGENLCPRILRGDKLADGGTALLHVFAAGFLDRGGEGGGRVFARPERLVALDDAVHVAAVNADDGRAAGLRFERDEAEGFLHARMNEEVGGAVVGSEPGAVGEV